MKSDKYLTVSRLRQTLDSITTYRVVLYGLGFLATVALSLSALNLLDYSSFGTLLLSLGFLLFFCFSINLLLGKLYKVATNHESSLITALILFFVLGAPTDSLQWIGIAFAAAVAITSKYLITWRSSLIFNPAAIGVLIVSLLGIGNGAWWIADAILFIPMLIVGFLVLLKLRRFELFFVFFIPAITLIIIKSLSDSSLINAIIASVTLYPLLFFGTIMLSEPFTMPNTRNKRLVFGVMVGLIFALNLDLGFITTSPHLALIIGNLFAFAVTSRASARLELIEKKPLTPTTYNFTFRPDRPLKYIAGQYIEITIPGVRFDSRGNRRTFTIVSPPSEELINIGVKFNSNGSQFKTELQSLEVGDEVIGNHIAGDFILPINSSAPLVFIAGGIGVTPFIAMIREMYASKKKYTTELYYFVSDNKEVAYRNILKLAKNSGIKVNLRTNRLTEEDIRNHLTANFYLSGPPGFVKSYKAELQKMGIKKISTDYFAGY